MPDKRPVAREISAPSLSVRLVAPLSAPLVKVRVPLTAVATLRVTPAPLLTVRLSAAVRPLPVDWAALPL